jgi:hypothetical protein
MKDNEKLLILKKAFDFTKWLYQHTEKFPRSHRFSIAVKMENLILEFIQDIQRANMRQKKLPLLISADEKLNHLRTLFRLSFEMQFINLQSYNYGAAQSVEIGKMLGGWIRQQRSAVGDMKKQEAESNPMPA